MFGKRKGRPFAGTLARTDLPAIQSEYRSTRKLLKYVWDQSNRFGSKELATIIRQAVKKHKKGK